MSTSTFPFGDPSTPTNDSSTATDTSNETESTGTTLAYNYFFLLFAVFGLFLFLLLLFFNRRRKQKQARLQSNGREALARDLEGWAGRRGWRSGAEDQARHSPHFSRVQSRHDYVLEAGLDERGEAPPPYNTANTDKAPPIVGTEPVPPSTGIQMGVLNSRPSREGGLLPGYDESAMSSEGFDIPARPATVVTVSERASEVPVLEDPNNQNRVGTSRAAERWGSTRRLMSSTQNASAA